MPRTKTRSTAKGKSTASKSTALTTQKVKASAEEKGLKLVVISKPPKYQIGDELFYSLKIAQEFIDSYETVTEEVVDVTASDVETEQNSNNLVSEENKEVANNSLVQELVDSEEVVVTLSDELPVSEAINTNVGDEEIEKPSPVETVEEEENIPVSEVNTSVDESLDEELPVDEPVTESTAEEQGILIRDAAVRLGISDEELRALLKGVCPPLADRISMEIFNHIADSLRAKIQSEQGQSEENNESALTVGQKGELSDEPKGFDESRLQLNINLQSQMLDLNNIAKTLALVAAKETVEDFRQIYTHCLNDGINRVTSQVAQETVDTINQLRAHDNRDFLVDLGKEASLEYQEVQLKVNQVMDLI